MHNKSTISITFTFVNPIERIKLFHQGEECIPDENNQYTYTGDIEFPSTLRFEMQGKDPRGADCRVDDEGNVVWDRYIIISKVTVDNVLPSLNYLQRWGRIHPGASLDNFKPSNQIVFSNYMGFNGVLELEFEGSNVLEWLLRSHQYKDDNWQKNYDYE